MVDNKQNLHQWMNKIDDHVADTDNPHQVSLSQLGYSESETFKRFINIIYPIGAIKLTLENTNPGKYLPGTEWQLISGGKYLKGITDPSTQPTTGGRDSYTINHNHTTTSHTHSIDEHTHSITHTHTCNSHALTASELPGHKHSIGAHSHGLNNHSHSVSITSGGMSANSSGIMTDIPHQSTKVSPYVGGFVHGSTENDNGDVGYCTAIKNVTPQNVDNGHIIGDHIIFNIAHTHSISGSTGGNTGNTANSAAFDSGSTGSGTGHSHSIANHTGNSGSTSLTTKSSGSETLSGSNTITLDPSYQSIYVWKRTA